MPVFRDQLDDVFEFARARGLEIKIADDEYEYTDLDDLQKGKGDRITKLSITFAKENPQSPVRNSSARMNYGEALFANVPTVSLDSEREDTLLAFYQETRELLSRHVPWFANALRLTTSMVLAALLSLVYGNVPKGSVVGQVAASLSLICFVWSFFAFAYLRRCKYLNLKRKHEVENFWQRNSDKILVAVITAIISSGITLIVNRTINASSPTPTSPASDTTKSKP